MTHASCFSKAELRSYLLGELNEAASDEVALHVEDCQDCEATVAELDVDSDTLIESLREPVAEQPPCSAYRLAATRALSFWRDSLGEEDDHSDGLAAKLPRLRDYELLRPLAQGGMGTVYQARHLRLNRQVALKVLPPRWLKKPALVARFEREMQAVGSLRHEAIVQATDGGEAEGVHFLVMELIDGIDGGALVQCLRQLSVGDACEIARQTALGMDYVHGQGIIHRDLKPSNLMVTKTGAVKVLDLGLARVVSEQLAGDELTTVGQLMGTIDFMAREQLENSHQVDERTDIYSLGATLYKLLTGRSPHGREPGEPLLSKIRRIATDPPIPLAEHCPEASPELCGLVDRMLSPSADHRPDSMKAVAESLTEFSESSDLAKLVAEAAEIAGRQPSPNTSLQHSALDVFTSLDVYPTAAMASTPPKRQRFLAGAAAALLLLAIVLGVVIKLESSIGQLVIETSSPGVEVRVLKAGQPHRQLTLNQKANRLRLGAGEYEIEIISDADALTVENGRYTLKRGETWLARIVHQDKDDGDSDADMLPILRFDDGARTSAAPTYEGKSLQQWLSLLRTERSPKQFYEACRALKKLTAGKDTADAVSALLVATRYHNSYTLYKDGNGTEVAIWQTGQEFLAGCDQTFVVAAISDELDKAKDANIRFILDYLADWNDRVRPVSNPQLITQVEKIAANPQSELRISALLALQSIGPEDVAVRRLVSALSAPQIDVRLFSARTLIAMKSNTPLVVSTLRQIIRSNELRNRAEAGWHLGDLGAEAAPAFPELVACLEDEDFDAAAGAVYRSPDGRRVSVKDSAIRALAEIGNKSVVPALIVEWEDRAKGDSRQRESTPAWNQTRQLTIASTYTRNWVADAIEKLTGTRPILVAARRGVPSSRAWYASGLSFERAYRAGFQNTRGELRLDLLDVANQLLPMTQEGERTRALKYIEDINRTAGPEELDQEIKLIELIATVESPQKVLPPVFSRWYEYAQVPLDEWKSQEQTAAIAAYQECSIRIIRESEDWKKKLPPFLVGQIDNDWSPAAIVFLELMHEFDAGQQVAGIVAILELVARTGPRQLGTSISALTGWLQQNPNRTAILQIADQRNSSGFENLMVGLLRSGDADKAVIEKLTTRFEEESINREQMLGKLMEACGDQPYLPQIVIDLIKHPALNVAASVMVKDGKFKQVSLRADKYLLPFKQIPAEHRIKFRAYMKELVESGKDGESEAAQQILRGW